MLLDVVLALPTGGLLAEEIEAWIDRIHVFGFHLARLDVRQDARLHRTIVDELLRCSDVCATPEKLYGVGTPAIADPNDGSEMRGC